MTLTVKHAFVSAKADGGDTSVVRPSDWNANHTFTGTLDPVNGGTGSSAVMTQGSVVFAGPGGAYAQDNDNLFFDDTNNRLGIGTATPGQTLEVYKASSPTVRIRNSATYWDVGLTGNSLFVGLAGGQNVVVDTGGYVGLHGQATPLAPIHVGSTTGNNPPTASPAILVAEDRNTNGSGHGFADESIVHTSAAGTGYAAFAASVNYTGSQHYDHYVGFQADLKYASAGTMTSAIGLSVGLHFYAGLATNFYGTYIYNPPVSGSSITNAYAHYVEDITSGTNNYAIYTAGTAKSYFGGAIGAGADSINATFAPQIQVKKAGTDVTNPAMSLILNRQNSNVPGLLFGMDNSGHAAISVNGGADIRIGANASGNATFTENVRITTEGNVKLGGTADRSGTAGTKQLVLFNGTAPTGTLANGVSLYSTSGELRVMDAAGNATLLSPHDHDTNEWVYDSIDTRTGKRLHINMERMMKAINDHFGWDFVKEFIE